MSEKSQQQIEYIKLLENKSKMLAESYTNLTGSLTTGIGALTGITVQHLEVYKRSSEELSQEIDQNIKLMETFINKCDILDEKLDDIVFLSNEIKDLKKLVTVLSENLKEEKK
eukprot:gene3455-6104_t